MASDTRSASPEALSLTVVAALLRLIPHPPNFAPLGAVSLLSGSKLSGWQAYAVPILAMLATDPLLSYLAGFPAYSAGSLVVYASFLINVLLARKFLQGGQATPVRVAAVAIVGSLQFFLLTNLAVWWAAPSMYAHTGFGLLSCYLAALPFFGRTLLGDLFYSAVLFIIYHHLRGKQRRLVVTN